MLMMTEARILLFSYLPILDKYVFLCVAPKWFELDDKDCWHFKNLPNHISHIYASVLLKLQNAEFKTSQLVGR